MVSWIIFITVVLGILGGMLVFPPSVLPYTDYFIRAGLCFLLFWVGVDIGKSKENFLKLKDYGWRVFFIPAGIVLGSVTAAAAAGRLMGYTFGEAGAVGAGFGWYSLSGVLISDLHSIRLGTVAFLANVSRELMAIILIPLVARKIGFLEAITPGGATAMDTTLPVISRSTGPEITIIAFLTGASLTAVVPVLVPLLLKLSF